MDHTLPLAGSPATDRPDPLAEIRRPADEGDSPAYRFVYGCARRILPSSAAGDLRGVGEGLGEAEWRDVFAVASGHGVAPLVFTHAAALGLLARMPDSVATAFAQDYRETLMRNRRMQTVLCDLLDRLAAAGIPVMALKGLGLACRYYGELALRPMTDIDILVPRPRVEEACDVLRAMGYAPSSGSGRPTGFNAQTHAVVDYLRAASPQVELHWELFNQAVYRTGLGAEAAWGRAGRIELFGRSVAYLAPADELRYLSVHYAAEHHLMRLIWGVDIAELVRALPASWDWEAFARETVAARMALPVAMALADCRTRLALSLPEYVLDTLFAAAGSAAEREAWLAAQAEPFTALWIRAYAEALRGPLQWGVFLRGVLLPRARALAELYGAPSIRWPERARTHLRHLRRVAPELAAGLIARRGR